MFFIKVVNNEVVEISTDSPKADRDLWQTRHDWKDLAAAKQIADGATKLTGRTHIGVDNGPSVWPRFDVVEAPAVGDEVSYAFNGDYYPDGVVTHVTPGSFKVVKTSTGNTYYRRRDTGRWMQAGGTWSLVRGHHSDKNPHF